MTTNFGRMNVEKRQAHEILDLVKAGHMISARAIRNALDKLGEFDETYGAAPPILPSQLLFIPSQAAGAVAAWAPYP
jgi:hypothetical protein